MSEKLKAGIWRKNHTCFDIHEVSSVEEARELVETLGQPAIIHAITDQEGNIIWRPTQEEFKEAYDKNIEIWLKSKGG